MGDRILILGAAGRLGYVAAETFRDAGWQVVAFVRPGAGGRVARGVKVVEAVERAAVTEAARGAGVILHALNTPYHLWHRHALPHIYAAIDAAEATGATLMFVGNLYNYGSQMPELLDETTPMRPTSRKGRLRVEMEQRIQEASDRGMRAIIVRAGDFFGAGRGSWFDLVVVKDLRRGIVNYPGPLDVLHAWAYVPDLAATLVRLAQIRDRFGTLAVFGFPGHAVTGRQLADAIARAVKRDLRVKRMQWWFVRTIGRASAIGRELAEIAYLWDVPHRISGERLTAAIGEIPHTPLDQAVTAALHALPANVAGT
jgi:nucleoside-diphosphate-sugar epimerase